MSTLLIVVGVVVVAVIAFFAMRKPAELPAAKKSEALPRPAENKRLEAKRPPAEPAAAPAGSKRPPPAEVPAPSPSAALSSADVLPAVESVGAVPAASPAERARSARPPTRASQKELLGMRKGLAAARSGFVARLTAIFAGKKEIDPAILEQVEEVMLTSDVGVKTTQSILERLRQALDRNELRDGDAVWAALRAEATRVLSLAGGKLRAAGKPTVVLMVGVNGVGKTTTIGKLATHLQAEGKRVMLAAGDTFRAAAVQQLEVWGGRVGAEVVRGKDGADPGSVAFEATTRAKEAGADFLLIDTAGRLHTKTPLMDEIKKVRKSIGKVLDGAPQETLLVVDATTGQNALAQAALFKDALELTGIVLTKLDGTAKGGIVLGICDELGLPVRYVGLGERAEDLREFQAEDFVEALFGRDGDEAAAA
jgi:fused signal recognition particle receptor